MASTYKAPGAYIEEITKFPPSVASVETAIPAFVGYTEIAEKNGESLSMTPTRIESFLEFEQFFGGPPSRGIIIRLNANNQLVKVEKTDAKTFLLYDSMRLFYDNGGGIAYVVSVGNYNAAATKNQLIAGLKTLEKFDEPTIIASPDAVTTDTGLYDFQQQALIQCNKLQDRFLICDLLRSDEKKNGETLDERVAQFRDGIGINYLKYGAAYVPWLKTSLQVDLTLRDVIFAYENEVAPTATTSATLLANLTSSPAIQQLLNDARNAIAAVNLLKTKLAPGGPLVGAARKDLREELKFLRGEFTTAFNQIGNVTFAAFTNQLQGLYQKVRDIVRQIKLVSDSLPAVVATLPSPSMTQTVEFKLRKDIAALKSQAVNFIKALVTHHNEVSTKTGPINLFKVAGSDLTELQEVLGFLDFSPAAITSVGVDSAVRGQFRLIAAREAVFAAVKAAANTALGLPGSTKDSVALAVTSLVPSTNDLKTFVDPQFVVIKAIANTTTARNQAISDAAAATADRKAAFNIVKAYVVDEFLNGVAASADLPGTVPDAVLNIIYLDLLNLKQAAETAAAIPGATAQNVFDAIPTPTALPRDYSLLAANGAAGAMEQAIAMYESVIATAETYEDTFDQSLLQTFGTYKTLLTKAGQDLMTLPPSAGIAGVYASVDNNRGVWKAPANASLSSVLAPQVNISSQEQEGYNVDPNAGKSINAIRYFTGKGILVWGTRTLAGNDNEWRYVPVRRYFNYAEESIKKATEPFVFEPNDLNTWVRVKAMIENFLTVEWRRGALAGAKNTDAYYVKVGLGETMTALDILEGRMIVEIGMAVVRPAEFIILRFAHKMQES